MPPNGHARGRPGSRRDDAPGPRRSTGRWGRTVRWGAAIAAAGLIIFGARGIAVQGGWLAATIRQTIVMRLSEALGRPVALGTVGGDLVHGIELRDLVIAERGGFSRGVAFSADRVRVGFDLPQLLLHPTDVLQGITQVDLYRPRLVIARDDKGAWNLEDLLTPSRTPLEQRFHGRVAVHDGIVAYADAFGIPVPPFATRFSRISGTADSARGHEIAVQFAGRSAEGEDASVQGRFLPGAGVFDLEVTAHHGSVGHWGGYLVRLSDLRWVAGRFDGRVHLLGTQSGVDLLVDYQGTLRLEDAEAEYLPTHMVLRHVTGTLALDTETASTGDLTLDANGSRLAVRGDIAYPGRGWLDLAISSPGLDLATIRALFFPAARIGLSGQVSGSLWITGPAGTPYLDGDVTSARGRLNRQAFDTLRTRFQYAGGTLTLSDLTAHVAGGRIAGDAVLDVSGATPSYLFAGEAVNLDTSVLPAAGLPVTDGLRGRATGSVAGAGADGRVRVLAGVSIAGGTAQGQAFRDLHTLFWDDDGAVDLSFLRAQVGDTSVYADGRVAKSGSMNLSVAALDLPLDTLSARAGLGAFVAGSADFRGRLTGTSGAPVLSGEVTAWDGHTGPVPFAFARGDLTVSRQGISSRHLRLADGAAAYQIAGGIRFDPLSAEHLDLDASAVPAASLLGGRGAAAITGTLAVHVTADGPLTHPSGTGRVSLVDGTIAGQRVDRIDASFAGDGKLVRITNLTALRSQSRLDLTGTLDPAGPLDLGLRASDIRLADIGTALGLDPSLRGMLEFTGAIRGTLRSPEVTGTLHVPDLAFAGQRFEASGTLAYQAGRLHVQPLALTQGAGRYSLAGDLFLSNAHPSADLELNVTNGQVATIVGAGGISLGTQAEGTINGTIHLAGPLTDPSAHLALELRDAKLGGILVGTGAADLTLSHGAIDIQRLELAPGQGQIAARGQVILNGTSSVEVTAHELDPNLLRPFFRLETPLVGRLDFAMQWRGDIRNPTAGLSLEATDIGVPGLTADRVIGLVYYRNGVIHIEDGTIAKGPHKAVIQGSLPTIPGGLALDPRGPLSLDVHLEGADLSLLGLLTPQVHDASGTIEGQVTVGGTVGNPVMSGTVRSSGGRLRVDPIQTPLEDVNVDIAFSQDQILLRTLEAKVGGGLFQGSGIVGISDFRPDRVALDLTARGVIATVPGIYAGGVDADLQLAGGVGRPVLSGTIALSHGRVAIEEDPGRAPSTSLPSVPLDVTVVPAADVWYDNGPVRAELSGAVHLGGTVRQPKISGTVRSRAGTIVLLGTPFEVLEGQAVFSEALGFDPEVSARALALYGDTRVFMDVNGVLPDASITWSSDPPLPQANIMGLVFGSSTPGQNPAVSQGLGRIIFGSMGSALRRAFRLDELSLSYDTQNPVTLRIGKFILQNFYLAVSQVFARSTAPAGGSTVVTGTTPAPAGPVPLVPPAAANGQGYTVVSLEYFVSPTISLTYDVNTFGDNGFYLLTRIPF